MYLSGFISNFCEQKKYGSTKEFFQKVIGGENFGTSYRTFRLILNKKRSCNAKLFAQIFKNIPPEEYKDFIVAFFEQFLDEVEEKEDIVEFLKNNINASAPETKHSIYETYKYKYFTQSQLNFLNKNPDALRLQKKLIIKENLPPEEFQKYGTHTIQTMINLDLANYENQKLTLPNNSLRLPLIETSSTSELRERSEYFLNQINTFFSKEVYDNQIIKYSTQEVNRRHLPKIREQFISLFEWIRHFFPDEGSDVDKVPIMCLGFFKELKDNDY